MHLNFLLCKMGIVASVSGAGFVGSRESSACWARGVSACLPDLVEKRNSSFLPSNRGFWGEPTLWGIQTFSEFLQHKESNGSGTSYGCQWREH